MATKKKVRYRHVVVRAFYRPKRVSKGVRVKGRVTKKKSQSTSSDTTKTENNNLKSKVERSKVSQSQTAKQMAETEVNRGPIASFEPQHDPYAYLISQLPNMLVSLPNLVVDPEQAKAQLKTLNDTDSATNEIRYGGEIKASFLMSHEGYQSLGDSTTQLRSVNFDIDGHQIIESVEQNTAQHAGEVEHGAAIDADETEQDVAVVEDIVVSGFNHHNDADSPEVIWGEVEDLWFDWLDKVAKPDWSLCRLLGKGHRRSWSKVVSASFLQPRFGGLIDGLGQQTQGGEEGKFLTGLLYRLAEQLKVPIASVLFYLSSVSAVRQFILTTDWHELVDCLSEYYGKQQQQKRLNLQSVTVADCVVALRCNNKIGFTHGYPPQLLAHMNLTAMTATSWSTLVVMLSQLLNQGNQFVLTVRVESYQYAIEICANEVMLFGIDHRVRAVHLQKFITDLQQYMAIPTVSQQRIEAQLYQHQGLSEDGLIGRYKAQIQNWQPILSQPLLQFVT